MKTRIPRRRGFAMATAVGLIPLAVVAMMSLGMLCEADFRRTASAASQAQLRQLLLAAAVHARAHLVDANVNASWVTPLPDDLASAGAKVETKMTFASGGIDLRIIAVLGSNHAIEQMHFMRVGQRWIPTSAVLGDPDQ